jgi:DNA-binding MarR family transcriptional regulator
MSKNINYRATLSIFYKLFQVAHMLNLSMNEMSVLFYIYERTIAWCKSYEMISLGNFQKGLKTGLTGGCGVTNRTNLVKAIDRLLEIGLISRRAVKLDRLKSYSYSINLQMFNDSHLLHSIISTTLNVEYEGATKVIKSYKMDLPKVPSGQKECHMSTMHKFEVLHSLLKKYNKTKNPELSQYDYYTALLVFVSTYLHGDVFLCKSVWQFHKGILSDSGAYICPKPIITLKTFRKCLTKLQSCGIIHLFNGRVDLRTSEIGLIDSSDKTPEDTKHMQYLKDIFRDSTTNKLFSSEINRVIPLLKFLQCRHGEYNPISLMFDNILDTDRSDYYRENSFGAIPSLVHECARLHT